MKNIIILFFAAWLSMPWKAFADNDIPGVPTPVTVHGRQMIAVTSSLPLLLQAIERGYPLVSIIKNDNSKPTADARSLVKEIEQNIFENQRTTLEEIRRIAAWKMKLTGHFNSNAVVNSTTTERTPVNPFSLSDDKNLFDCIRRTLPF